MLTRNHISNIRVFNYTKDTILIVSFAHIILNLLTNFPETNVYIDKKLYINISWGIAGWSRTQLLGEIARGGWGLMKGTLEEVIPYNKGLWEKITKEKKPIFAGKNDFSCKYEIDD